MEQVHGVDVSWMTKASPKDRISKPSTSPARSTPAPAPTQPRSIPKPSQDARSPQGTPDAKTSGSQQNGGPASPTLSNGSTPPRRLARSVSTEGKSNPNGAPALQRRNSWFSNISAKFSSSANSPPSTPPAHHHSLHHLHLKESHEQPEPAQQSPLSSPQPLSPVSPLVDDSAEPLPPKLHPTRNAVLQHAAVRPQGNSPYTPAPPKSGQAGFLGVFRRLSSSSGGAVTNTKLAHGLVERRILNVDQNRERCKISELKEARLRRVSFCVDVEIAPMPKYADGQDHHPRQTDRSQRKRTTEKGEGDALKKPQAAEVKREAEEAPPPPPASATTDNIAGEHDAVTDPDAAAHDGAADETAVAAAPDREKDTSKKKKEKKKRSEEERKARKEKRRRLAEDNGSVPIEIHYDVSDSSSEARSGSGVATPKSSSHPTTNPARIYRRCCQLRESPILKKVTEQLMDSNNVNVKAGTVAKLDLTDYFLQFADSVTLGDYLAVVPVKEMVLENSGLGDEGLRVILAGLLAAKMPQTSRRRRPKHDVEPQGGVVERLVIKNNKLGPDGWKHISLFLYKCRSLKSLDISHIPFPCQAPSAGNGTLPNGLQIPRSIADVFSTAIAHRPGGSTLEMVNMGETDPSMEQLGAIMDGVIKCGVKRLGLAHNSLDAEGMKHVSRYLAAGVCEGLDLGGNDLTEHVENFVRYLDESRSIWALSIAGCNLTPSDLCKLLPALAKKENFRFIDLSHNHSLFDSTPSALGLLRRYLPKMQQLKRIHLQDVNMSSEQAIALVEILPEVRQLAHINLLGNVQLAKLTEAKTEEAQEEACALFASLLAATRISKSLVAVDIEVPKEDSGEIVKAMAKQVVAYCLRNMEPISQGDLSSAAAAMPETQTEKAATYPDVLAHLVGHDVMEADGPEDDNEDAPDEDYVIGGTGVVKALTCCLKNRNDDSQRHSGELIRDADDSSDEASTSSLSTGGKAKDLSKHLLAGARKIRQRLQPALNKARSEGGDEMNLRKLTFLDETLQGIIKRFEDEFPDTREPGLATVGGGGGGGGSSNGIELAKVYSESDREPQPATTAGDDSAVAVSEGEEETTVHVAKPLSRTNSVLSRELAEEEARVLRAGHRFRAGFVRKEQFDRLSSMDDIGSDPKHAQMLVGLAEELGGDFLDKVREKGAVRAYKEDKDLLFLTMRDSDPDHWPKFLESQQKARDNIAAAAPDQHGAAGESAIADDHAV